MNKRKSFLEKLRLSSNAVDTDSDEYKRLSIVKDVMLRYYEIYDIDQGTIHTKVFTMLYLSPKHYTYKEVCEAMNISKNTLVRYVEKYDETALKIIKRLNL